MDLVSTIPISDEERRCISYIEVKNVLVNSNSLFFLSLLFIQSAQDEQKTTTKKQTKSLIKNRTLKSNKKYIVNETLKENVKSLLK